MEREIKVVEDGRTDTLGDQRVDISGFSSLPSQPDRHPTHKNRLSGLKKFRSVGVLLLLTAAGCSSPSHSEKSESTPTKSPTTVATTTTTTPKATTTTSPPASTEGNTWYFTASATGGYTESGNFSTGPPEKLTEGLTYGGDVAWSGCDTSPALGTDAAIPIRIEVKNTTSGFPTDVGFEIGGTSDLTNQSDLFWNTGSSSAPQCTSSYSGLQIQCPSTEPNETCDAYGWAIITNYYSPSMPNGNSSLLKNYNLQMDAVPFSQLTSFTGPGGSLNGQGDGNFNLSGMAPSNAG